MSKWAGKFVIGLTGNIGTGKSVVRRMLEHLGAYGIDADAFGHRAMAKGAPGYTRVVDTFGKWILTPEGEINRARLGKVVFADPEALAMLEAIIHPLVLQATDWVVSHASQKVVVIEAIKLLESNLAKSCDSVWTVYTPPEVQITRLMQKRGMTEADARARMTAQPPQEQKMAAARVVIQNGRSFEDTWKQVSGAWQKFVPSIETSPTLPLRTIPEPTTSKVIVSRGRPRDAEIIATLMNRVRKTGQPVTRNDIMAEFGDKAFLLMRMGERLIGVAGWQVENLVARTTEIVVEPSAPLDKLLPAFLEEMEHASKDLQCEASLVFTPPELANDALWKSSGYERRTPQTLGVSAWQEAALETLKPGQTLFFKQLRQDRVLRPI